MTDKQAVMWDPPARDQAPIEKGGAVVVIRLSPGEAEYLLTLGLTLHEAVHDAIRAYMEIPAGMVDEAVG